jgi:hypothetical protein
MASGIAPPPDPEELARRPKDLIALLDAIEARRLRFTHPVNVRRAVVLGHS